MASSANVIDRPLVASPPDDHKLARLLVRDSSALGFATVLERGLGFFANVLAARIGGAPVFGAYSLSLTTANSIATYAGAGIGTTANRFSGEFPIGSPGYRGLLRSLAIFSLSASCIAAAVLWIGAAPLASVLMKNPALTPLLRIAALSAGALILVECLRGLLIGQRRFAALIVLSVLVGVGMLAGLPAAAGVGPPTMILTQAAVALVAVAGCVLFARQLKFAPPVESVEAKGPHLQDVGKFGLAQLAGMVGINAVGWFTASLLARGDSTLVQMGFYSVALQIRNICGMLPLLISQTAFAQLTERGGEDYGGANRVTLVSTLGATILSLSVGTFIAAILPYLISGLYGKSFEGSTLAATIAVATGIVHMSLGPASARLTIVSLRLTTLINAVWAAVIAIGATLYVSTGGAVAAATIYFCAHVLSSFLILTVLWRRDGGDHGLLRVLSPALIAAVAIPLVGWMRYTTELNALGGLLIAGISCASLFATRAIARSIGIDLPAWHRLLPIKIPGLGGKSA
jgi:O-antigen/teichoic acid export membrane protein